MMDYDGERERELDQRKEYIYFSMYLPLSLFSISQLYNENEIQY